MNKKVDVNFEKALDELESIVEDLESGDLSLEDSLNPLRKNQTLKYQEQLSKADYKFKSSLKKMENLQQLH